MTGNCSKHVKIKYLTATALLSASAIVLSGIEMSIPNMFYNIPGTKIGLSNISVIITMETLNIFSALFVCVMKALFAFITRGFTAGLMSMTGGILSCLVMYFLFKSSNKVFGYIGICIIGALTHNMAQLTLSSLAVGKTVWLYMPAIIIFSITAGCTSGIAAGIIVPKIKNIDKTIF